MKKTLLIFLCLSALNLSAATVTSVSSGSWFSPGTWSGNTVPAINDVVVIAAGITVTVDLPTASVASTPWDNAGAIKIYGTLELQGTDPLFKTPVALEVFSGGLLYDNTDFSENIFTAHSSIKVDNGGLFTSSYGYPNIRETNSGNIHYLFQGTSFPGPFTLNIDGGAITYTPVALPVHLKTFNGELLKDRVRLDWTTADEISFQSYDIERASDGAKFEILATISAKEGSENAYSYIDNNPMAGNNLYRLTLKERNGQSQYSPTLTVNLPSLQQIKLYPVPAKDKINIQAKQKGQLYIYSATGQLVLQSSLTAGDNLLDIRSLASGLYYAKFKNQKITFTVLR